MPPKEPAKPSVLSGLNDDIPIEYAFETVGSSKLEPPKWVIKNVIPVGLTIYKSPPKMFKSTTLLHYACRVIGKTSTVMPEHLSEVIRPGPVCMIATEVTAGSVKFDAMFGLRVHILDTDPFYVQTDPMRFRLDNKDNVKELLYWLRRIKPSLFIVDTFRNSHSMDENDAGEMVALVQPLQQYAIANDMACVLVFHDKKPDAKAKPEDILKPENARGSGAVFGLADALLAQVVTNNGIDTEKPQIKFAAILKRGGALMEDVELNVEWGLMKLDMTIASNVYNFIYEAGNGVSTEEICMATDHKPHNIMKYLGYMNKHRIITDNNKEGLWEIERRAA